MTVNALTTPRAVVLLLAAALLLALLPPVASAQEAADTVVISQVYGGGGNSGATYTHDFVELHNPTETAVDLAGRSVQYASATGTGNFGANAGQLVALSGTIQPGGYYLVQLSGGSTGAPLPPADDTGTISMGAAAGKVALAEGTDSLGCNGGSSPCDDDQRARIIDLVGYGNANFFEGTAPAPALSNSTAALRLGDGAQDTDDNAADFLAGTPAPRNSGTDSDPDPDAAPVVISQVYGGGGNSGATYTHDFIELHNPTDAAVDVTGWSVQYASATGSSWSTTELAGSVPAGGYYLIQQNAGAGGTQPLPTPDATGTISMAGTNGKVALASDASPLSACPDDDDLVDLVGYGSADCFEGSGPAPVLSNSTAAIRKDAGGQDTDDNAADFTTGAPAPRNSGTDPDSDPDPVEVCAVADDELTPIHEIQGAGATTPIPGEQVVTRGVVTAEFTSGGDTGRPQNQGLRGFFLEAVSIDRDEDPATSEGIFVFESSGTFVPEIGDLVAVAGTVGEFGGSTQVSAADLAVCSDAAVDTTLPAPVGLPLPVQPDDRAEVFEPLESMRVTHPELTVTEFYELERYGVVQLSSTGVQPNPTNVVDPRDDASYEALRELNAASRIALDDGRTGQNLYPLPYVVEGDTLRIGDQLRDRSAILHDSFGVWRLQPIDIGAITEELRTNRTRPRPEEPPAVGGTLTVASFNVLNYFNGDGFFVGDDPETAEGFPTARGAVTPSEFVRQTEKIVDAITRFDGDIVGLIEIENDGGERQAAAALVDAVNTALGADVYDFVDTGQIGDDAIKLAFIYKPDVVEPVGDFAILDSTVDPRFEDDRNRPVLAQTFTQLSTGRSVTVAVNHLKSKGSPCAPEDNDPRQGNCNGVRERAAEAMADWLATDPTGVPAAGTLIIGDLNAYAQEDPIQTLEAAGYTDLLEKFGDGTMPYTYTFGGTQGYLDHALADGDLLPYVTGAAAWNINADEVPAIDYKESCCGVSSNRRFRHPLVAERYYDPSAFRSSDHDPVLIGLAIPGCPGGSHGNGNAAGRDACPGGSEGRGNAAIGWRAPLVR